MRAEEVISGYRRQETEDMRMKSEAGGRSLGTASHAPGAHPMTHEKVVLLRWRPSGSGSVSESLSAFDNGVFDTDTDPDVCRLLTLFAEQESWIVNAHSSLGSSCWQYSF